MTKTYRVPKSVSGSANLAGVGTIDFRFEAGSVTPKTEADAAALEHLESIGLATSQPAKAAKAPADAPAVQPTDKDEE